MISVSGLGTDSEKLISKFNCESWLYSLDVKVQMQLYGKTTAMLAMQSSMEIFAWKNNKYITDFRTKCPSNFRWEVKLNRHRPMRVRE